MKYIIEIKPEYEANGIMILGARDSHLYVTTLEVKDLEELNSDYINEHFGSLQDDAYKRGLEDGKAVNDKGCEGCMYKDNTIEHHPCGVCCNAYSNRWTAKDDKIEVGDVVIAEEGKTVGIVTKEWDGRYYVMWQDGSSGMWLKESVRKTGRHFDIDKILEAMKHD